MDYFIGVDIGGTKCAITSACISNSGEDLSFLEKVKFPTEVQKGVEHTLNKIMESVEAVLDKAGNSAGGLKGIGISCGGPLDSRNGIILSPPNLIGWDEIHIVDMMEKKFGIRTRLQNDANACALAEWKFGAARGAQNVIFLTFGTGMGAGLILDGRLYSGTNDMAGEVGHVRLAEAGPVGYGKSGSFEGLCSGGGIAQLAGTKVLEKLQMGEKVGFCSSMDKLGSIDARQVAQAAQSGDELAGEIYEISGKYLGLGLSMLIDILNPEVIVIGSIFERSRELLWPSALAVIEKETLSHSRKVCKIVPAHLGDRLGDYAAIAVAAY